MRIWHPADRAVLEDADWSGMKHHIDTKPAGGGF